MLKVKTSHNIKPYERRKELSAYQKFRKAVKDFVDSKEIASITIDIGVVRVVVKGKKKLLNNSD